MSEFQWSQPPGWAVDEATYQLDEDATWDEIAELAWELVEAEEADEAQETDEADEADAE
jgi:hypothetical protein